MKILSLICRWSRIWPYRPSLYVNLCTLDHDNSSCTILDRATRMKIPRPVMACRSSWYSRDINLGTVIGYRPKDDVRSGLFVDLLHGDKCYMRGKEAYFAKLPHLCTRESAATVWCGAMWRFLEGGFFWKFLKNRFWIKHIQKGKHHSSVSGLSSLGSSPGQGQSVVVLGSNPVQAWMFFRL